MDIRTNRPVPMTPTLAICCALLVACPSNESTKPESVDAGPVPLVHLSISAPSYLQSGVSPDAALTIKLVQYDSARNSLDAVRQLAKKSAVIEEYPALKPVVGTWSHYMSRLTFTPASPLATGDYVLRFPNASSDFVVTPRPYNVFLVGSKVLRLAEVHLLRDKSPGADPEALVRTVLRFSEAPPASAALSVEVKQLVGSKWTALSLVSLSQTELKAAQPIDPDKKLSVTISGAQLDGAWTGVAGSGPAVAEFVPRDHQSGPGQVQYYVPPDLSINLPSGTKKP